MKLETDRNKRGKPGTSGCKEPGKASSGRLGDRLEEMFSDEVPSRVVMPREKGDGGEKSDQMKLSHSRASLVWTNTMGSFGSTLRAGFLAL